jgi:alpha-amylase/alpha-mannosidase (GH57 family)
MARYVCIHLHCYQPPRENPWLAEVEAQDSAAPYHDWNERITAECYGPCSRGRIVDGEGRIVNLVNAYSRVSFNFGPTLLGWMERHAPETYEAVIAADRLSRRRFGGHGSAIAQAYNHMIMPLASARDRLTQALWGMEDFRWRFGRDPEGMWLPECAADTPTLETLASCGIRFVLLAQRQAARSRLLGRRPGPWREHCGDMDPTSACLVTLPSGRTITAFFHDAAISADMAFGHLARDGQALFERLLGAFTLSGRSWPQLVNVAADGETFGHHHKDGDMTLAWCLDRLEKEPEVRLVNFGQYLARHRPALEVEIVENSSWSCVHGVERWRADCGCNSGGRPGWTQGWRKPLRQAMEWLAVRSQALFTSLGAPLFADPMAARDEYIRVMLDRSPENASAFLNRHALAPPSPSGAVTMLKLLEMERLSQLTFTSCGWFFDEVSGIETVQVMQYASRCVQLAEELSGRSFEKRFAALLAKAPSNVLESGADAYERHARPARAGLRHVAAHAAMAALFSGRPESYELGCWRVRMAGLWSGRSSGFAILCGQCRVELTLTLESREFVFAAAHLGGHHVVCGVERFEGAGDMAALKGRLARAFERGDQAGALSALHARFGEHVFGLTRLFKDEQRAVLAKVTAPALTEAASACRRIYQDNMETLKFLSFLRSPTPREVILAASVAMQRDLEDAFGQERIDAVRLRGLIHQAKRWGLMLDMERLSVLASAFIGRFAARFAEKPRELERLENLLAAVEACQPLGAGLDLWRAQAACFKAAGLKRERKAEAQGTGAWTQALNKLARALRVRLG